YSSDNQREESIEGQLRECLAYAEKNNLTVVNQYIDRAFSARTDDRPAFRQMIRESEKKAFSIVLVWKLDRFSRDRYDSAYYKHQLKKHGVRVVSATENISEGPEGIILESMLEGMAEYYSAELAVKVRRGQQENALKCRSNGGTLALGYRVSKDRTYEIDPEKAVIVQEIFRRYDNGESLQVIADSLNARGLRNQLDRPFRISALGKTLRNRKYLGEYHYDSTVIADGIPQIISEELFARVQERMDKNKRAPARAKANEEYLLTTKLFCGYCGTLMAGESGTSKTGAVHYYYKCGNSKRHKGCNAKAIKKHWIEQLVVETTVARVFKEEEMHRMADAIVALQDQDNPTMIALEMELKDCEKKLQNLMDAILAGIHTSSTKAMLEELESQREHLQLAILQTKLRRPVYTKEVILQWIKQFKDGDMEDINYRRRIIDVFVNSVYVYDDKLVFTYNFRDGNETVSLLDIERAIGSESSDLTDSASPKKERALADSP
ncbi:MAG: recombinase family protein, partial [Lachnospiraceae bacterium]|nr:recombinase family protein [Lachnospiraceae bacterium]